MYIGHDGKDHTEQRPEQKIRKGQDIFVQTLGDYDLWG